MLDYDFTTQAERELRAIATSLQERNGRAAAQIVASIIAAIERACVFPDAAPEIDEAGVVPGTRKLVELPYRYVIYYCIRDRTLLILRIFRPTQSRANP